MLRLTNMGRLTCMDKLTYMGRLTCIHKSKQDTNTDWHATKGGLDKANGLTPSKRAFGWLHSTSWEKTPSMAVNGSKKASNEDLV